MLLSLWFLFLKLPNKIISRVFFRMAQNSEVIYSMINTNCALNHMLALEVNLSATSERVFIPSRLVNFVNRILQQVFSLLQAFFFVIEHFVSYLTVIFFYYRCIVLFCFFLYTHRNISEISAMPMTKYFDG